MGSVLLAVIVCCAIAAGLTVLILIVNATIGNYGNCEIDINNGEKNIAVEGGESLLSSLSSAGIFIPSACGGKGSCGLCKVKVLSGGNEPLLTELPWLEADEVKNKIRLSCQVKVKNDLRIEIPSEYFNIKEFKTKVKSIIDLTYDIKEVALELIDPNEVNFKAGQFMQIKVPQYELSSEEVYRAYSISSPNTEANSLEFQIRLVPNGICTTYVHEHLKEGQELVVNGPYGDFYLRDTEAEIVFVAGGSGMAPVKSILHHMKENNINRKATYFFGARTEEDLFHIETMKMFEEALPNFKFIPSLSGEDIGKDWTGETGIITDTIKKYLEDGTNVEAYMCGSPGMINACVEVLKEKSVSEDKIYYDNFG